MFSNVFSSHLEDKLLNQAGGREIHSAVSRESIELTWQALEIIGFKIITQDLTGPSTI